MIEILDIGINNVVAYRVEGKVTENEMQSVLSIFKDKIQAGAKVSIYQEIVSVGGAELDAIIEKLKFFSEFGISHFDKIAILTQKNWMHKIIDLKGKLFKAFDMKGFSIDDKEKALEFLRSGK